jgi:hypothetical protein
MGCNYKPNQDPFTATLSKQISFLHFLADSSSP